MKIFIKYILQKMLGIKTYLYLFALFVLVKIRRDKKEKDFFHFLSLLPPEGVVLDLGANIGVTTYHLSKKLPGSTIFSFEPLAINMEILRRIKNRFHLNNVREYLLAVGDKNTTREMVMPEVNKVMMHGLSHVVDEEISGFNAGPRYEAQMVRLDDFPELSGLSGRLTGMKIDVENYEYHVLKGAEKIISANKPVIYCELWNNTNREKCISFLNKRGYSAFILLHKTLIPFRKEENGNKQNYFFIPD